MSGELSQSENAQAAIVLYGDAIQDMDEARRQEVAESLEMLLGVKATVRDVSVEYLSGAEGHVGRVDERADKLSESANHIPPFTLLAGGDYSPVWGSRRWDYDLIIEAANRNAPGVIENNVLVKRALSFVRGGSRKGVESESLFSYHFEPNRRFLGNSDLVAVTFNNPQAIVSQPEKAQENIPGLGPKTTLALAQFVVAMTSPRIKQ